jgi:hypothetical protein
MPRVLGVHGIGQQYRSAPELTRGWWEALRGGLEVAGFRATADGLAQADVRVAFFGDLFRPQGALAGVRRRIRLRMCNQARNRTCSRPGTRRRSTRTRPWVPRRGRWGRAGWRPR